MLGLGEVIARHYRHPSQVHHTVMAGATWEQIAAATGGDPGDARQANRERAEGQHQRRGRYSVGGRGERILVPQSQGSQRGGASLPGGHLPAAQDQQGRDGLGLEPLGDLR
jgi:hypothetical protein